MEPSIIPKRQLQKPLSPIRRMSFASFASLLLFFVSLALFGGVFGYKKFLEKRIEERASELKEKIADFEPATIKELIQTSRTIEYSKAVLAGHPVLSNVFKLLENLTLPKVRFLNLGLSQEKGEAVVMMKGEAQSYTEVSQQAAIFEGSKLVREVKVSNLSLVGQAGNVGFDISFIIEPELIKFKP